MSRRLWRPGGAGPPQGTPESAPPHQAGRRAGRPLWLAPGGLFWPAGPISPPGASSRDAFGLPRGSQSQAAANPLQALIITAITQPVILFTTAWLSSVPSALIKTCEIFGGAKPATGRVPRSPPPASPAGKPRGSSQAATCPWHKPRLS